MMTEDNSKPSRILDCTRLGWLVVESFGRLRRWAKTGRVPGSSEGDAGKRFNFSDRQMNLYEQLLIALERLKETGNAVLPEIKTPVPANLNELLERARENIDSVWLDYETYSREVWNRLQIQNPEAGQAFTYGGSLGDTYWHAEGTGGEKLTELLSNYRLDNIANRFTTMSEQLDPDTAAVLQHTLGQWRVSEKVKQMDEGQRKRVLDRLEAQAKVWGDLLFGLQEAESYLLENDRKSIRWVSIGATVLLVALVGAGVWGAVLLLAGLGRTALAVSTGTVKLVPEDNSALMAELLDWEKWSSLLATFSSVVVVVTGYIQQVSGWINGFHGRVEGWLRMRAIFKRTTRRWDK